MMEFDEGYSWRKESGMVNTPDYKRRFAFLTVNCSDGTELWMKHYYSKYNRWTSTHVSEELEYCHTDFVENITEEEYIVRKLADEL
jgi:hypothetical protein